MRVYNFETHCGLGTAQVTAIADINSANSISSCIKNVIVGSPLLQIVIIRNKYVNPESW